MFEPTALNREALAKFLPNHQAIKTFEKLIQMVAVTLPDQSITLNALIDEVNNAATTADSKSNLALSLFSRIAESLETLALAPSNFSIDYANQINELSLLPPKSAINLSGEVVGNLDVSHLNGATGATATTFWRGDGTWGTPSGAGDVVGPVGATNGHVVLFDGATGKLIKDGGALGTAAFNATGDFLATPVLQMLASIASATYTTMFTPSGTVCGHWIVRAALNATGAPAYQGWCTILWDGSNAAMFNATNNGSIDFTLSGNAVQVRQNSGAAQNIYWSCTKLD